MKAIVCQEVEMPWRCLLPLAGMLVLLLAACGSPGAIQIAGVQAASMPTTMSAAPTTAPAAATSATSVISAAVPDQPPATCPVTRPPAPPFTPPPPYSAQAPFQGDFWYGTDSLWTAVPKNGMWDGLPLNPEGYTQKVFWWRKGYSIQEEPLPALRVAGQRLDASAPPLNASRATNAFASDIQSAMLVGVDFPTPGCWKITGQYNGQELSFVVWVAP